MTMPFAALKSYSPGSRLFGVVVALLAVLGASAVTTTAPSSSAEGRTPNIVVIMVDDMRADEMPWMPRTRRLLGQFELTEFVANHPLCCPARAEFLTGQLGHHNGVHHSSGAHGGYDALLEKGNTIAAWFDDAGYATSLAGKFVNGWSPSSGKPGGWDRFTAFVRGAYNAYDFTVWRDGRRHAYERLHNNDFVTGESISQIDGAVSSQRPFFHYAAYTTPHGYTKADRTFRQAPVPARRHQDLFERARPPSASAPSYDPPRRMRIPDIFRQRIRALQSVDEGVAAIVEATKSNGSFEDTVFVFTSDNGYLLGEHGLRGKNVPYEEALRVPLLAAGPGVPAGASAKGAMITDLAASLSKLAGVVPGRPQDGRDDLFSLVGGWQRLLIQAGSDHRDTPWWWRGVRERRWVYVRFTDRAPMLFDRRRDPYQLHNLHGELRRVEKRLRSSLPEVQTHARERGSTEPMARRTEADE
jgi:N-acetylglucosamine-6-sulfatase